MFFKVSTAISKLYQVEQKSREGSPVSDKKDVPRRFARGADFSQLLQRFSGSDRSSCERSDGEQQSTEKKFSLKRQEAYTVSSSDEGAQDTVHKLPERTQSLRLRQTPSPDSRQVQRSSSLKSSSLQSHFSPNKPMQQHSEKQSSKQVERDVNSRLGKEPASKKCLIPEVSDKPSDELAFVLNQRSEIVSKQQILGEQVERHRIHDRNIEKEERQSAAGVEEVIVDRELASALKARHTESDNQSTAVPSQGQLLHDLNLASTSPGVIVAVTDDISDNIPHSIKKTDNTSPVEVTTFLKNAEQGIPDKSKLKDSNENGNMESIAAEPGGNRDTSTSKQQKAVKDLLSSKSPSLTRTQSAGRSDSMDRQKQGILKRTPSLPKQTRAIVDKELAGILNQRRKMEGNTDESDAETDSLVSKSVYDDIRESSR